MGLAAAQPVVGGAVGVPAVLSSTGPGVATAATIAATDEPIGGRMAHERAASSVNDASENVPRSTSADEADSINTSVRLSEGSDGRPSSAVVTTETAPGNPPSPVLLEVRAKAEMLLPLTEEEQNIETAEAESAAAEVEEVVDEEEEEEEEEEVDIAAGAGDLAVWSHRVKPRTMHAQTVTA